jgi:hypothetical protein
MMKRTRTVTTRMARAVQMLAIVALVVALAGCSIFPKGGQTVAAAIVEGSSIPGSTVSVDAGSSYNGFQKVNGPIVFIDIEPGFEVRNPGKLVDFLIRLTWSMNDNKPTRDLMVVIDSADPIDATAAAQGAGWKTAHSSSDDSTSVFVDLKEVEKRLGGWPGDVPVKPAGVIGKASPSSEP